MKFVVYTVKEADINNEVFEGSKVGDLIVFSFEGEGEDTKLLKYPSLQGHRVSAAEAGTGAFVNAKEGDLGVLKDDVFLTESQLSEALSSKQELTELNDDDLENIAGGRIKGSTFIRDASVAVAVKIPSLVSKLFKKCFK